MPRSEDQAADPAATPPAAPDPAPATTVAAPAAPGTNSQPTTGLRVATPFVDFFEVTVGEVSYTISRDGTPVPPGAVDEIVKRAGDSGVKIEKVT